jgi:tetratricopeptide (TPR) repeat protein
MSQSEEKEELQIGRKLSEGFVDDETTQKLKKNGIIIGIVVLIALIGIGYYYYTTSQAEKASKEAVMALSKALPEYDQGNYKLALDGGANAMGNNISGLAEIANKYDNVNEGKLAALYAGNAYVNTNQFEKAKKYFDIATGSEAKVVQSGAYAGLAVCDEASGAYEKAADNYKKAAELLDEDLLKSKYLYFSAINYEEAGKKETAKDIYQSIVDLSRNSDFGHKSVVRLSMLGTKFD